MESDPVVTNPGLYTVLFENERVRVLEYLDAPGTVSVPHRHPEFSDGPPALGPQ